MIETVDAPGGGGPRRLMVGREVLLRVGEGRARRRPNARGRERDRHRRPRPRSRSRRLVHVRAGEIVGIAGVDGNGQSELIDAITGLRPVAAAGSYVDGQGRDAQERRTSSTPVSGTSPRIASAGVSCSSSALPRTSPCTTTTTRPSRASAGSSRGGSSPRRASLLQEFDVRGGGPQTRASALSGGNQQKVILAREVLARPARADRSAADARARRRRDRVRPPPSGRGARRREGGAARLARARGGLARRPDPRVYEGRIVAEFPPTVTQEDLGVAMTGAGRDEVAA